MNGQDHSSRGRPFNHKARFDFGNVIGDPFALATVSIGLLAWLITLVSAAYAQNQAGPKEHVPKFIWWTIAYEFCCVIGIAMAVAFDSVLNYQSAIVGFQSASLVFSTSAVNAMVYDNRPAVQAAAAGQILMSMVSIVWIFYFGSTTNASSRAYVDQFSLHKDHKRSASSMRPYQGYRPETASSHHQNPVYAPRLSGMEATSPDTNPTASNNFTSIPPTGSPANQQTSGADTEIVPPTEYPYTAKAIYNYTANPEDANEISFSKHEILEVSDVSGRWWQARKANGETGIAPSNYLILL